MAVSFWLRGLLIGLSVAAVVGPMSVLCIQRTLRRGFRYGLLSGLGVACADALYGSVAAFGLSMIGTLIIDQQAWIRLIGGLFLLYLGGKTLLARPAEHAASVAVKTANLVGAYLSTLLLTLTNPLTILSFAAIFAGFGVGSGKSNVWTALLVVGGVFSGSACWWLILTGAVSLLRGRFTARWLLWIHRISGAVIALFGLFILFSFLLL
ncbi:LysE family translocator [Dictyobacter arantiisoli]|nr:LysE family transporter [Dictyobacter arantiisoli]